MRINISKESKTKLIAEAFSKNLISGDILLLNGELGVGKTTFARNFINQLQYLNKTNSTEVLSPTFSILNEYQINNLNVKHYDLYRLKQIEELDNLGLFEEKDDINIIEWPEILQSYKIKIIKFDFSYSENFEKRSLVISSNYNNKIVDEFK